MLKPIASLLICCLLLFTGCSEGGNNSEGNSETQDTTITEEGTSETIESQSLAPVPMPDNITGYYEGTLACADCEGIFTQIELQEDSSYLLFETYKGKSDTPFATFGNWKIADNKLVLSTAGNRVIYFQPTEGALTQLAMDGSAINSSANTGLDKAEDAIDVSQTFHIHGRYIYFADATSFKPCGTDNSYPIMDTKKALDLQRAYLSKEREMRSPMYVSMQVSMKEAPNMEGKTRMHFYVEKFIKELEEDTCP